MTTTNTQPKALLTMGLPGAGKSHVLSTKYAGFCQSAVMIDPDLIKQEKVDYDPKNPAVYHEWSKQEAKKRQMLAMVNGQNLVVDGTGTNVEKMVKQIRDLESMGYEVEVVYVRVKLTTSIQRNASRERTVPVEIIMEKHELISTAFEILSSYTTVTVVNND